MKDAEMHMLVAGLVVIVLIVQIISLMKISTLQPGGSWNTTMPGQKLAYITVTATGSASAKPTTGTLYLNVQGNGKTSAAATANLTNALQQVNSSIMKYINGNLSNIKTSYYNIYNQSCTFYCYNSYNGFVASEQLTVTIPNVQNMSGAIGALSAINNVQVSSSSGTLSASQISALRTQAFVAARQNATAQASAITGTTALSIQNITVNSYYFYPIPFASGTAVKGAAMNSTPSPAFYSGVDTVTESLTIVYSYGR